MARRITAQKAYETARMEYPAARIDVIWQGYAPAPRSIWGDLLVNEVAYHTDAATNTVTLIGIHCA